ncbi:hypothetical protein BT96DRAFT_944916 [Gymnopus androsaceus JB14]|uniref:Uncharacterized protein n=1 Tax=Gymnopus androsaceus JB14 TaxID=1447944 RepID=A0A6A4H3X5_9AGAR|nr:hypothetical protein BT96DRAFT_944916 [Gymnopus androsaceus JB14]
MGALTSGIKASALRKRLQNFQGALIDLFQMVHSRFTSTDFFRRNIGFCTIEVPGGDLKLSRQTGTVNKLRRTDRVTLTFSFSVTAWKMLTAATEGTSFTPVTWFLTSNSAQQSSNGSTFATPSS